MIKELIFLITLFVNIGNAAIPTVESLFRNVGNPDIDGDLVRILFSVELKENELQEQQLQVKNHPELLKEILEEPQNVSYVELVLYKVNENSFYIMQVIYNGNDLKKVKDVQVIKDVRQHYTENKNIEGLLFLGLMSSLGLNDANLMVQFLKKNAPEFKDNQAIINREKLRLLEKYKSYLSLVKDNKDLREELESPFEPKSVEEKEKINKLKNEPMYKKSDNVKLVRVKNDFFWEANLNSVEAYFSNEKQQLRKFLFKQVNRNITVIADQYVLFDGSHELPKLILFKDLNDRLYHIRPLKFSVVQNNLNSYFSNYYDGKKKLIIKQIDNKEASENKFPFLFKQN